ncbi:MAG: family 16 glycosylhydrolase [Panacibacter sp.]
MKKIFFGAMQSCSKGGGGNNVNPPSAPAASINTISSDRTVGDQTFQFQVSLSAKTTSDVTVHYSTVAGTALEGQDYISATGTLTIPAGETKGTIDVTVKGDSLRTVSQQFYVQLDQPQNCTLKTSKGTGIIVNENGLYFPVDNTGYSTPNSYAGYTLAWADEFTGNAVNTTDWTFETGGNGWGNNELENYTARTQNAFVSNGNLIIEARTDSYNGSLYTSARMITKNKKTFRYGWIDIRAKLPKTKGIWPALWMLGNNVDAVSWPACGEIDIMELLGQEPSKMYSTLHYGSSVASHGSIGTNYSLTGESFDEKFHVFSMDWQEDSIKTFVDGNQVFVGKRSNVGEPYPFNNDFFFIFNIAIGGNWPGAPDNTTEFPQRMVVDYVRVFQK